jgi:integrase
VDVLAALKRNARRSVSTHLNFVIVRLACCCGLRASEIAGLRLADVVTGVARPHIHVRKSSAKNGRARRVPLWWDAGTLQDVSTWKAMRIVMQAADTDPLVCSVREGTFGHKLTRHVLRRRFQRACRVLGNERVACLTTHHGRHTFISHALAGGRSLAEVRDAAGHANVSVTSAYLHVVADDDGTVGDLFSECR